MENTGVWMSDVVCLLFYWLFDLAHFSFSARVVWNECDEEHVWQLVASICIQRNIIHVSHYGVIGGVRHCMSRRIMGKTGVPICGLVDGFICFFPFYFLLFA